jgi:hypothetical protein
MDREKLVEVYTRWLTHFENNPHEFSEQGTLKERAERCTDYFLFLSLQVDTDRARENAVTSS